MPSTAKSYTITYNANGGTVSPTTKTVNCTFSKWNTNSSGSGTNYSSGDSYSANSNVTLYAQWINSTAGDLATPSREKYTFDGWYTSADGGTKITSSSAISSNMTVFAHWTPIPAATHTVTYNYSYNGGTSATLTTATIEEGSAIDLTPTATKSGWEFVGWNTDKNAQTKLNSLTMGESNVTLYAIYKKTITGTFIDYAGTTKTTRTASVTIYNLVSVGVLTPPAMNTYSGWEARGWSSSADADADPSYVIVTGKNGTYYGLYEKSVTLSYNANGGSSTPSSQTGTMYTNSYSISNVKQASFTLAPAINKSNCIFNKWAMNSTSGVKYDADSTITVSANTTMYATWIIDTIPSVVTEAATDVTKNAATLSGRITSNGGHTITSRKIIYYEKLNPSSKYTKNADENFTVQLTNLKPSTEYCFQAIAVSEKGTGSGEVLSFKTKDEQIVLPNRISVSPTSLTLEKGKTRTLFVTVLPTNANNSTVTWTSNNETVATVVDGVVYARSKGNAKITVRTNANGLTAVCNVSVTEMNYNISPDFSEINMVTNSSSLAADGFDWGPDDGGNNSMSTAYLARWDGAVLEKNDKYPDPPSPSYISYKEIDADYHVQEVLWLPKRTGSLDNDLIKQTIMKYGAVSASFCVNWNCFNSERSTYYLPNDWGYSGGHAITIVGWDDSYSKNNFVNTPPGNGAFICKNSWGTMSGEDGYFYISYYDQQIGYRGTMAVFANLETNTNYNKIYQYDPLGAVGSFGFTNSAVWTANVFPEQGRTLSSDEKLCAASFYTRDMGTSYELYVVTDYHDKDSLYESRQLVASGVMQYAGYHTVPFKEITLNRGTRFAIIVKLSLPNQTAWAYMEYPFSDYSSNARANSGESFYSSSGETWSDLTSYTSNANCCIKAFTNAATKRGSVLLNGIDNAGRKYEEDTIYTVEEVIASGGEISDDFLEYYYGKLGVKSRGTEDDQESMGGIPDVIEVGSIDTSYVAGASYPSKYDLRTEGCVSPVRDQGDIGSCWSFAAYASLESCLLKKRESMSAASSMDGLTDDEAIDALINDTNVELNSISLEKNEYVFKIGEQRILEINLTPRNAAYPGLIWTSSDNSIVMVDTGGMITGVRAGMAMIEATTEDGRLSAQCFVRIAGIEPMSTAVIDYEKNLITGIQVNLNSLTPFIQVTDDTCSLQYQSIGTGKEVYLTRDNEIVDTYTIVVFGDVDGNGWYDGTDAFYVNCIVNGLLTKDDVGDAVWLASDCNHDGKIDQADVSLLESAGLLLADVDQTATIAELESNSAYQEYIGIIDQLIDPPLDYSNRQATTNVSESNDSQLEDEQSLPERLIDSTNKKSVFVRIYILIISMYQYVIRFLFGLVGVS